MKYIYKTCGKISLLSYVFMLYQLWHSCQYGGLRSHLLMLAMGLTVFCITFILWLISRRHKQAEIPENSSGKKILYIEIILFMAVTIYFSARIVYSAIPYNGALSWKLDEKMRKKEVTLEHNNFFEDGVEGILKDLDTALYLPEELYITDKYQMTFDENGTIQAIDTFMYGKDDSGATKTYLADYDANRSRNVTVWINGEVNADYDENMRVAPMLKILEKADCEEKVRAWSQSKETGIYEILYYGRRSFKTKEGLKYLSGDVDGDGRETGMNNIEKLKDGGEIKGFEVSLHIPEAKGVFPVRYIMEPEYISQDEQNKEQQEQQVEDAMDAKSWTIDQKDGSMYFFLDNQSGWKLVVTDAAAGSRFYAMEKTENGGSTWERVNEDPFGGTIGVTEGLVFFDKSFGFAGLTGASQSYSRLYVTRDGGATFQTVQLPMDTVTELPELAAECKFTIADYDYFDMPEKENDVLTIKVTTEAGESEGILFQSRDNGEIWVFVNKF